MQADILTPSPRPILRRDILQSSRGVLASLLLHLLAALSIYWLVMEAPHVPRNTLRVVPVDVVIHLADETRSPPAQSVAPVPQQAAHRPEARQTTSPRPPEGTAPNRTRAPPMEDLDAKLRGLARLRQAPVPLPELDNATAPIDATSAGAAPGDEASYSVRDYVRAQAERRWNLDFAKVGSRRFTIPIHVVMRPDGTIVAADIVDKEHYTTDAVYRSVALSARNALLLSSPILLPAGTYESTVDMTIVFNPRDMVR